MVSTLSAFISFLRNSIVDLLKGLVLYREGLLIQDVSNEIARGNIPNKTLMTENEKGSKIVFNGSV
jgi:hypothetical protein